MKTHQGSATDADMGRTLGAYSTQRATILGRHGISRPRHASLRARGAPRRHSRAKTAVLGIRKQYWGSGNHIKLLLRVYPQVQPKVRSVSAFEDSTVSDELDTTSQQG